MIKYKITPNNKRQTTNAKHQTKNNKQQTTNNKQQTINLIFFNYNSLNAKIFQIIKNYEIEIMSTFIEKCYKIVVIIQRINSIFIAV